MRGQTLKQSFNEPQPENSLMCINKRNQKRALVKRILSVLYLFYQLELGIFKKLMISFRWAFLEL